MEIAVAIAPSEAEDDIWYFGDMRGQHLKVDSAEIGFALTGSWGVYIRRETTYTDLYLTMPGRMLGPARGGFSEHGPKSTPIPLGVKCIRQCGGSLGRIITAKRSNEKARLSAIAHSLSHIVEEERMI